MSARNHATRSGAAQGDIGERQRHDHGPQRTEQQLVETRPACHRAHARTGLVEIDPRGAQGRRVLVAGRDRRLDDDRDVMPAAVSSVAKSQCVSHAVRMRRAGLPLRDRRVVAGGDEDARWRAAAEGA